MKKKKFRRFKAKYQSEGDYILRDFLAMERTTMANERTLFSYIRTSFYLILAGFGFLEIDRFEPMQWLGYFLFGLSIIFISIGIYRYHVMQNKLNAYYKEMEDKQLSKKDKSEE